MTMRCTDCGQEMSRQRATRRNPYHFVQCGVRKVWLAGIDIDDCGNCGAVFARIPQMRLLHRRIALALCTKPEGLSGKEIRFIRKAAGYTSLKFASLLGITNFHLSRMERRGRAAAKVDKLARAIVLESMKAARDARTVLLHEIVNLPWRFPEVFVQRGGKWTSA